MRALGRGDHEDRVARSDPVALEPVEEPGEGPVVVPQPLDVAGLARYQGVAAAAMARIGEEGEGHRDAVLLHGGHVGQADRWSHRLEAAEALEPPAFEVGERLGGGNSRPQIALAIDRIEPFVAAWLIG